MVYYLKNICHKPQKPDNFYISITGLVLKKPRYVYKFWWYALGAMLQARQAPGNWGAYAKKMNNVYHTVSLWTDHNTMRQYLTRGAHLRAMVVFPHIATGKVFGYTGTSLPDWPTIHQVWHEKGRTI